MQQQQKTIGSVGWLIGGIGFSVAALLHAISMIVGMVGFGRGALGYFFLLAGDVVAIVAMFTKKRDILLPVAFASMSLGEFIHFFSPFTGDSLFAFLAFIGMCAIAVAYFTTILPEKVAQMFRDYGRALWFVPAAIFVTSFVLSLAFRGWGGYYGARMGLNTQRLTLFAPLMAFVAMWIVFPDEGPTFDFGVFKRTPAPQQPVYPREAPAQQYQPPVQQQPVQQPVQQQPVYQQPVYQQPPVQQPEQPAAPEEPGLTTRSDLNISTQLKVYQELLTDGIITAEEYEQKRREILGL